MRYTGTILTVDDKGRYAHIGLASVEQEDGTPHGLDTERDIFLHRRGCTPRLMINPTGATVGTKLIFEVKPGREKGQLEAFNADLATELLPATEEDGGEVVGALALPKGENLGVAVRDGRVAGYLPMKPVPPGTLLQVQANQLLEGVPADNVLLPPNGIDEAVLANAFAQYLCHEFPALQSVPNMNFSVGADIEERVREEIRGRRDFGAPKTADVLEQAYALFLETRRVLAWILDAGLIKPGSQLHPFLVGQLITAVRAANSAADKSKQLRLFQAQFEFMHQQGILRPNSIMPMRYLPHFALATPVWYLVAQGKNAGVEPGPQSRGVARDPEVDDALAHICRLFPQTRRWADYFLMWNRRLRTLANLDGIEVPPPHIREIIKAAAPVYDFVWVATPYFNVAGADWDNPEWVRAIDPYVFGFMKGLDSFSLLGRYAEPGGVLPHYSDLVADMIEFLRNNVDRLEGFDAVGGPYWHDGQKKVMDIERMGAHLIKLVKRGLLPAFEQGTLAQWILSEDKMLDEPTGD